MKGIRIKFCASRRLSFEDTSGNYVTRNVPEKFRHFRERAPGPWIHLWLTVLLQDTAQSICVSESRYTTAVVIIYKNIQNSEFRISIEGVEILVLVAFETYRGRHHMFFANKIKWLRNWFQIKRCVLFGWSRFGAFFNFISNDTANIPAVTKLEL